VLFTGNAIRLSRAAAYLLIDTCKLDCCFLCSGSRVNWWIKSKIKPLLLNLKHSRHGHLLVLQLVVSIVHGLLVMLLQSVLNHLDGSIDVALVEGDLEVAPRLGYLDRTFPLLSLENTGLLDPTLPLDFLRLFLLVIFSNFFSGLYLHCCLYQFCAQRPVM